MKGAPPSCSRCHVEHMAARTAATLRPETVVGDAPCRECHEGGRDEEERPLPPRKAQVARRFMSAPAEARLKKDHPSKPACQLCHFYHVAPRGYAPSSLRPTAIPMKHYIHLTTMTDILKVQHRGALCRSCHQARADSYSFAPFTRQGCNRNNDDCHAIKKPEGAKKFKDPLAEQPIAGFTKPKPPNALFMHSKHIVKHSCADCHPDAEKSKRVTHAPLATAEMCARCHKDTTRPR